MHKFTLILFLFTLNFLVSFAQKGVVTGTVMDATSGETLIGVNIIYGKGLGTITDVDGKYQIELPAGSYTLSVSYVGYVSQNKTVTIGEKPLKLDFSLENVTLSEVNVVADVARARETPVAFSTVTPRQIQEQLAGRDIPMLLNSTPGVYASQMGGADGDARVTIRGFSSRNVGVLLDGVPVNDMENGIVYWSNWFGLDNVTRSIQVQRGLGASKLALPSVGGTINIMTKGIDERKGGALKQEFGSDGYLNTSFGYNSGRLKQGIGFTVAGSYKRGDGWVNHTQSKAYFFYGKVDKFIGKHVLSLVAYGAPQSHAQHSYNVPAAVYDLKWAKDHGVDSADMAQYAPKSWTGEKYTFDHGTRFNQHWGTYETYTIKNNGYDSTWHPIPSDTSNFGGYISKSERVNEFFKPQFTLKDFWTVNSKLSVSNIAYISIGRGGGIRAKNTMTVLPSGEMDFQSVRDVNSFHTIPDKEIPYSTTLRTPGNFLVERKNEHQWIGLLSTVNYILNPSISMSGGIDLRTYKGVHYEQIYDLLGADYVIDATDQTKDYGTALDYHYSVAMHYKGDKISYYNDGLVRWGGLFYQAEYKNEKVSAFINLTGARSGYKRIDHFKVDSVQETPWKWINGWTIKGGANYNISEHFSAFMNLGYLDKAPRFSNVYDNTNKLFREIKNEMVRAVEGGLAYGSRSFSANINIYYTNWLNKPVEYAPIVKIADTLGGQTEDFYANINGLAALHKGVEIDFAWQVVKELKIEGIFSSGDWIWNSADSVRVRDDFGVTKLTRYVNAKGIHVGDAAQFQVGGEIRYEPIKNLYISGRLTYFGKYYSNFDPMDYDANDKTTPIGKFYYNFEHPTDDKGKVLLDENGRPIYGDPISPWKIPAYMLLDLNAGYSFKVYDKYRMQFRLSVLNATNTIYVSDADDNSTNIGQPWSSHDTRSAAVFFGLGRRYTASVAFQF